MPPLLTRLVGGAGDAVHLLRDEDPRQVQQVLTRHRLRSGAAAAASALRHQGVRPGLPARREQWTFVPARKLHALVQAAGARTLLFGTYARREGDFDWDENDTYEALQSRVDEGYAQLGAELGVPVVPVGRIWRETLRTHPRVRLWLPDGMHPTPAGTYLAACAFFVQLYGQTPVGNAYLAGVDPTEARIIQEMVARERSGLT